MELQDVKRNMGRRVILHRDGRDVPYLLNGCIMRKGVSGLFYQAELLDVKSRNSVVTCRLEDIKEERP